MLRSYYLPALSGTTKKLVFCLHGTGGNGGNSLWLAQKWRESMPNVTFFGPNGIIQVSEDGFYWFDIGNPYEEQLLGMEKASKELNEFVDRQLEKYKLTDSDVAFVGNSEGAMLGIHAALRRPGNPLLISYSGVLCESPDFGDRLPGRPKTLMVHGANDDCIPVTAMMRSAEALRKIGVDVTVSIQQNGHGIDDAGIIEGEQFLKTHLLGE